MSLIKCKECGKEISSKTDKCPNCGAPTNRTIGCFGSLLFIFLVAVGIIAILGITGII